jgi:hypothetical protein
MPKASKKLEEEYREQKENYEELLDEYEATY